ncbi:DUF2878 domain-containing protein [Pseudomarimonas arenosa]|uniref:DUF2878 domain-containing protein n=1 Tax=Pseudomarimonas arenosa TaxID=2774145 RepID=A0AAW3ZQZ9_9GAMM|nr:DUF2878 domain-containing protein [Pseudomarimonas arenosa]MBD8527507.1 DUF2878 domain-containing protein [Pseudomarimonas arenosa]
MATGTGLMRFWANLIGFQAVWMASVGGAANGYWWLGPLAVCLFAGYQIGVGPDRRADLLILAACAVLGFLVDSLWVQLGWMQFASPLPWAHLAPVWIVAMWIGFALTLNHSLAGFKKRLWLAAAFGLVGGPLAYYAAARAWSAVAIAEGAGPYIGLALAWGVLTPLLLLLAERWQRATAPA